MLFDPSRRGAVLGTFLVLLVGLATARSSSGALVTLSVDFSGPQQTLGLALTSDGEVYANASGIVGGSPIVLNPNPQSHAIIFDPNPSTFSMNPASLPHDVANVPAQTELDLDDTDWSLLDIRNLNLDLTNGFVPEIYMVEIIAPALFAGFDYELDFDAVFRGEELYFFQSGPASIVGNTFSISGLASLTISYDITLADSDPPIISLVDYTLPLFPVVVNGTYSRTVLPGANPRDVLIELDANAIYPIDYSLEEGPIDFAFPPLIEITGDAGVDLIVNYDFNVHLETMLVDAHVPEPASIAMLGLGTAIVLLGGWVKRRKQAS